MEESVQAQRLVVAIVERKGLTEVAYLKIFVSQHRASVFGRSGCAATSHVVCMIKS